MNERIESGRWIYWQPTFLRTAKHRLRHFPEKTPLNNDPEKGPLGYELYTDVFVEAAEKERIK